MALIQSLAGTLLFFAVAMAPAAQGDELTVFVKDGCFHCAQAKKWLETIKDAQPVVQLRNISTDAEALAEFERIVSERKIPVAAVPLFVFSDSHLVGFDPELTPLEIRKRLGFAGEGQNPSWLSDANLGLPLFTVMLGLLDGFNPCAMWVLAFLLSLLVHIHDRRRMALIAGVFVLTSGVVYFAFMAAWLRFFQVVGAASGVRYVLAGLALLVAGYNLKDFLFGFSSTSLTLSDQSKSSLGRKAREILRAEHLSGSLISVMLLAVLVNFYELVCTAGLPALYTSILARHDLPWTEHYAYLALYNLAYVLDDGLMVFASVYALASIKMSEVRGRYLKLLSGLILAALGLALLFRPELLTFG